MSTTLQEIEKVAERIERAYLRRRPSWHPTQTSSEVWSVAAANLLQIHRDDPTIPVDPELYVAMQPLDSSFAKPWEELTPPEASARYRRHVLQLIDQLRTELDEELGLVEGLVRSGESIEVVLLSKNNQFSPLGRYIVAQRAHRPDLARQLQAQARRQHRCCPLYRPASRGLLPGDTYPTNRTTSSYQAAKFSLN